MTKAQREKRFLTDSAQLYVAQSRAGMWQASDCFYSVLSVFTHGGWTTRGVIKVWRAEVKKVKAILAAE
jgi:hypothetical protein